MRCSIFNCDKKHMNQCCALCPDLRHELAGIIRRTVVDADNGGLDCASNLPKVEPRARTCAGARTLVSTILTAAVNSERKRPERSPLLLVIVVAHGPHSSLGTSSTSQRTHAASVENSSVQASPSKTSTAYLIQQRRVNCLELVHTNPPLPVLGNRRSGFGGGGRRLQGFPGQIALGRAPY